MKRLILSGILALSLFAGVIVTQPSGEAKADNTFAVWFTVPIIGDGSDAFPYQPDLSAIEALADVEGWAVAGYGETEALVYVVTAPGPTLGQVNSIDGAITAVERPSGTTSSGARQQLRNETRRLGLPEFNPDDVYVNPGVARLSTQPGNGRK